MPPLITRLIESFPVAPVWAEQGSGGTHVNVSGVGLTTAASAHKADAIKLMEYLLTPEAQRTVRQDLPVPAGAPDLNQTARLDTGDTIDKTTAIRLLLEAGSFTRIITDPVTGVILDMDRTARTATRQQREWLLHTHATCTRDGCSHPAAESDIDHWDAFHGPGRGARQRRGPRKSHRDV